MVKKVSKLTAPRTILPSAFFSDPSQLAGW
jgi:hypothetical protein